MVFFGIDGSGKTTIVKNLTKIIYSKQIYMGSNEFLFQKTYLKLRNIFPKNKIVSLFLFFCVYLENWIKTSKIILYKLRGFNVFVDRHPSYAFFLANKKNYILNKIFYHYLFIKPSKIVFLYETPEIIHSRKKEASIQEILQTQKIYTNYLKKNPEALIIKNTNINKTINQIIKKYELSK